MAQHTHDGIDWAARVAAARRTAELEAEALRVVARRLVRPLPDNPTVYDVGCGVGAMSVPLAEALAARGGGTLVLVDAVPEVLDAATSAARSLGALTVKPVLADLASEDPAGFGKPADLVWASRVVHHLPDQLKAVKRLVGALAPGGWLALAEGGLEGRMLPWDLGVGEPGLQDRLAAARAEWFCTMREGIPGAVQLPVGWNVALGDAGLGEISAFSFVIDHPAPAKQVVRDWAVERLGWLAEVCGPRLHASDRAALRRLLNPRDSEFLGARDDVFMLMTDTVHMGRKP
ncbi:class I SAM-dependent methyltransferase [Lentzea sp. NBRC 105346]|uniref:class I SAM-dependent methyltransferase n=1 Tax=Lentzea sp. NBRC 105346 TaxID=3032205 RepID=UPI0025559C60|nr:class I SAM-dependent methyltransferase [Lentzea sp. NBRC 105346]